MGNKLDQIPGAIEEQATRWLFPRRNQVCGAAFHASFPGRIRAGRQARCIVQLARTLELAGMNEEAKRAYAQYAKLYPGGPWAKAAEVAAAKL